MFEVEFYQDSHGHEPVKEFLIDLQSRRATDKQARVLADKVLAYIRVLQEYGTRAGVPYVKKLDGDIWELRPLNERILFFTIVNGKFILLHHFRKKTQKTPRQEIDTAKRRMKDYIERTERHGN